MTQKELLYVEDAIGHEQNIESIIKESINYLEDDKLISFMNKELKKHQAMEKKLVQMLEDKVNEW